jgi:hypothetical protein
MSHSGRRGAWEERGDQQRAHHREQEVTVVCKNLVYLHKTPKGGVLVQENRELAGDNWRVDGKKTWVPAQACLFSPPLNMLTPGDAVSVELPKRLADEKEMFYE